MTGFLRLRIADRKGNLIKDQFSINEIKSQHRLLICSELAVNGKDILHVSGVQQGPEIGRVLNRLLDFVVEHGPQVNTREQLLSQI